MINILAISLLVLASQVSTEDKRAKDGLPSGKAPFFPGVIKEARIANKSLKYLKIAVLGQGNALTAKQTVYNYYQMKELAANTNFSKKTVIYLPGYIDHVILPTTSWLGIAYRNQGYNVWFLDYMYFNVQFYPVAFRFVRTVSQKLADMLVELTKYGLNPKKLHLTGFSLGAHCIGMAAKAYSRRTGINISHITGLDPSGPCLRNLGPEERVDASDADFVEVLHTNMDGYGFPTRMGHIDFYINGGEVQPAFPFSICDNFCSHVKAFAYWVIALNNPKCFIGMKCDSIQDARDSNCYDRKPFVTNYLGTHVNRSRTGIFYISIGYGFPPCVGEEGLKKENNPIYKQLLSLNSEDVLVV